MTPQRISILVVDDNEDLAAMLAVAISREPDMVCVGTLTSADGLISAIESKHPTVVLLDLTMPGPTPLAAMTEAIEKHPTVRVIVMSGYDDTETQDRSLDCGAWGFVSKNESSPVILDAIRSVSAGRIVIRTRQ